MLDVLPGHYALVTGASSGIGEEIARRLSESGIPVILTARSTERLNATAAEWREKHQSPVETVSVDLSRPGGAAELLSRVASLGLPVDLLVNNAGFAMNGPAADLPIPRALEMLNLNVMAPSELMLALLRDMKARGHGRILNVASTTAFLPTPYLAAYGATKAYLLSLSQAVHVEAKSYGVTVTCLCPGYTRTGFNEAAGMKSAAGTPFPEMSPRDVARIGLRALERGKAFAVTHPLDRLWIAAGRLLPRTTPPRIAAGMFKRSQVSK
jgi:hypothetical protein